MENLTIDIILPSFNRSPLLERAIRSVLQQSYPHFNLYVINDGSTDETDQMMEQFTHDPRLHYIKQENKGVSAARNLGIKMAQSSWVAFLDSDDEWLPSKLEVQVQYMRKYPTLRFFHSNEIWMRNFVRVNPKLKFDKSNHEIFKRSLETCLISPSTVLMRKELAHFDERFTICEDYDLWLKILAVEEVCFIPDYLIIKHGGHADQLSTQYPAMDYWRIKSLVGLLKNSPLNEIQKSLVIAEIKKKGPILLQGYEKHQNVQMASELKKILEIL